MSDNLGRFGSDSGQKKIPMVSKMIHTILNSADKRSDKNGLVLSEILEFL